MIPFRVFHREKKEMFIVINFHPDASGGGYLVSRQTDSDTEGEMLIVPSQEMKKYRFEGFIEQIED